MFVQVISADDRCDRTRVCCHIDCIGMCHFDGSLFTVSDVAREEFHRTAIIKKFSICKFNWKEIHFVSASFFFISMSQFGCFRILSCHNCRSSIWSLSVENGWHLTYARMCGAIAHRSINVRRTEEENGTKQYTKWANWTVDIVWTNRVIFFYRIRCNATHLGALLLRLFVFILIF